MRKFTGIVVLLVLCLGVAFAQEKKEKTLALKALAPAVQKTIQAELKGGETMYEAAYTTKAGKKHEVLVQADGAETKD